jgi:hypothetical protein
VIDLVRNLHCLDPASTILLYDGGDPPVLNRRFPFARVGAIRHPAPSRRNGASSMASPWTAWALRWRRSTGTR